MTLSFFSDTVLDNMDNGLVVESIFLVLTKAFDTVDHQRLIHKLHSTGLSSHIVECLKSYLPNRCQATDVGNALSCSKHVSVGVP